MKDKLQDKLNKLKQLAEASTERPLSTASRSSIDADNVLVKAITTREDAIMFMAELNAAIQIADLQ